MDLKIVTWHGEGRSLFHVVDVDEPEDEQPAVVNTFHERGDAEAFIHHQRLAETRIYNPFQDA